MVGSHSRDGTVQYSNYSTLCIDKEEKEIVKLIRDDSQSNVIRNLASIKQVISPSPVLLQIT